MLNIFAMLTFSLALIVFKILGKNSKNRQIRPLKGNNSYKGSSDNFEPVETFVDLNELNIFAILTFSLVLIVFKILGKNSENPQILPLKGNNSNKGSSDDFDPMETFVELLILKGLRCFGFFLSIIVFEL